MKQLKVLFDQPCFIETRHRLSRFNSAEFLCELQDWDAGDKTGAWILNPNEHVAME